MFTLYQIGFPGATKSYSVQDPMLTALARSGSSFGRIMRLWVEIRATDEER